MNLFWETRRLTQAREDHLTCFLAAALETDIAFRRAYEQLVLSTLGVDGNVPHISELETQAQFRSESCRPDLLLRLADGRIVICEHKLEAGETPLLLEDGEVKLQLSRYLALRVDGVVYFRSGLVSLSKEILAHPKYVRPQTAAHFLWRDLYPALLRGEHAITGWLRESFDKLGFTPPLAHVGELWPDDSDSVRQNQANFGKLWHSTRSHAELDWIVKTGHRCELYLTPRDARCVSQVYISPIAQNGTLLRIRVHSHEGQFAKVLGLIESVLPDLPIAGELIVRAHDNYCDILVPLQLILASVEAADQEAKLYAEVTPVLGALTAVEVSL